VKPNQTQLIEARGINLQLNGRLVLNQIDLCVQQREIVTLIGPNGAGKTTLVKVILGLLSQTAERSDSSRVCASAICPSDLHCRKIFH